MAALRAQPYRPLPPLAHPEPRARSWCWQRWRSPGRRPSSPRGCKLKTAFSELLPSNDPGVIAAVPRTQKRMGDMSLLLIGVRSPDYAANLRYAEALTAEAARAAAHAWSTWRPTTSATCGRSSSRTSGCTSSEDDLESIRDRLRNEISKRKNPLFVSLERGGADRHDAEAHRSTTTVSTSASRAASSPATTASTSGSPRCRRAACSSSTPGEALFKAANELIAERSPLALSPADDGAEVAGPIATGIANRQAVDRRHHVGDHQLHA